jgi:hypothetical protein
LAALLLPGFIGYWIGLSAGLSQRDVLAEEMRWWKATHRYETGSVEGLGDYRRITLDSGRTWYEVAMDSAGSTRVLGPFDDRRPDLAWHLAATETLYAYVRRRGSGGGLTAEGRALLERAGFTFVDRVPRQSLASPKKPDATK